MQIVKDDHHVEVHYTGTLDSGEIFDSSRDREPLAFTVGAGQMIPGFENAVRGMKIKETRKITLLPDEAYGEVVPDMIQQVPMEHLPAEIKPYVGQQLSSQMPDGQQIVVIITDVKDDHIVIDANHPLAGQSLTFEIELVSISEE